jgi:hypothetical protein
VSSVGAVSGLFVAGCLANGQSRTDSGSIEVTVHNSTNEPIDVTIMVKTGDEETFRRTVHIEPDRVFSSDDAISSADLIRLETPDWTRRQEYDPERRCDVGKSDIILAIQPDLELERSYSCP